MPQQEHYPSDLTLIPVEETGIGASMQESTGVITDIPGYNPAIQESMLVTPELITEAPFTIQSENQAQTTAGRIINEVPTAEALRAGSEYEGEEGEYADAARLIKLIERFDPKHKLQDPKLRAEVIGYMGKGMLKKMLIEVNRALYPNAGDSNIIEAPVTLSSGTGDEKDVGFIGADPQDIDELLDGVLEGVKYFAANGDMEKAGGFLMNSLVPIQMMKDGNKRMARAMYELVAFGYDGGQNDQAAIRARLAHTYKARNSINYSVARGFIKPYLQEDLAPKQRIAYNVVENGLRSKVKRTDLRQDLQGIADESLRENVINVLQQSSFGGRYVFDTMSDSQVTELIDKQVQWDREGVSTAIQASLENMCKSMDNDKAKDLVEKDRQTKKEYLLRIMDSTTNKRPLPVGYDYNYENPLPGRASIA